MTARTLKEGLQMAHELVNNFFEVGHLMNRFLIFKFEKKAVMAPYKEVYKGMQKAITFTSFLAKYLSPPLPSSKYPDNFQPGTLS
jgi:hypothetical protein